MGNTIEYNTKSIQNNNIFISVYSFSYYINNLKLYIYI